MTTIRAVVGAFLVLGVTLLVGLPTAGARQEGPYVPGGPIFGDLVIEGDDRMVGATVALVGGGFGPESTVTASIRSNAAGDVVLEMEDAADASGDIRVAITLGDPVGPGAYTARLFGMTEDGAMVELVGGLIVQAIPEPTAAPTAVPTARPPVAQPTRPPAQQNRPPALPTPGSSVQQPTTTPVPLVLAIPSPTPEVQSATAFPSATPAAGGDSAAGSTDDGEAATSSADDAAGVDEGADSPSATASEDGADDEAAPADDEAAASAVNAPASDDSGNTATWVGIVIAISVVGGGALVLRRLKQTP